jgi:hypothetical protein
VIWNILFKKFNSLVESIEIDKFDFGNKVNYLDITIFIGKRFQASGIFDLKLYQKQLNIHVYAYIPLKSDHPLHTIEIFILGELKRYIKCNSDKIDFCKTKSLFTKDLEIEAIIRTS